MAFKDGRRRVSQGQGARVAPAQGVTYRGGKPTYDPGSYTIGPSGKIELKPGMESQTRALRPRARTSMENTRYIPQTNTKKPSTIELNALKRKNILKRNNIRGMRKYDIYITKKNAMGRMAKAVHKLVRGTSIAAVKASAKKENPNSMIHVFVHY